MPDLNDFEVQYDQGTNGHARPAAVIKMPKNRRTKRPRRDTLDYVSFSMEVIRTGAAVGTLVSLFRGRQK